MKNAITIHLSDCYCNIEEAALALESSICSRINTDMTYSNGERHVHDYIGAGRDDVGGNSSDEPLSDDLVIVDREDVGERHDL